jgi:EpsI family protein
MFSVFDTIPGRHILFLQKTSALIGSKLLMLFGIPVFRQGYVLELPHISLSVVEACAGLNHIISLAAIAVLLGYATNMSNRGKILLVVSSFFISILANSSRIALIGLWTFYNKNTDIHGPSDFLLVSFVFIVGFFSLLLMSVIFGNKNIFKETKNPSENVTKFADKIFPKRFSAAVIIATTICFITGAALFLRRLEPVYLTTGLDGIPSIIENWVGKDAAAFEEPFYSVVPDSELKRIYTDPRGNKINLFIGYFVLQEGDKDIFNPKYNDLLFRPSDLKVFNSPIESPFKVNTIKFHYNSYNGKRLGCAWYIISGKFYSNQYAAKLATFLNITTRKRNNAAIVIMTTKYDEKAPNKKSADVITHFTGVLYPILNEYFN